MVKGRCWKCKKLRNGVELCATDDRLCQSCFRKNEEELESLTAQRRHNTTATTRSSGQVAAMVRTADPTTRRDDNVAEPSTSKETRPEDVDTGRSPSAGYQTTTIIRREDRWKVSIDRKSNYQFNSLSRVRHRWHKTVD